MNYYAALGRYGFKLHDVLQHFDFRLARWCALKLRGHCSDNDLRYGYVRIARLRKRHPYLFAHWSGHALGRAV
jgi:hypothetical protein